MTRLAVVGHVEWVHFLAVETLPARGQITAAERVRENGGGGAVVAACVMAELGAEVEFFCAVGDDALADRALAELRARGIAVHAARRPAPTREVITLIDARGERSIVTIGERLQPALGDGLDWERLRSADGVYFTAGDQGALTAARTARRLVVTPRICERLGALEVDVDALVYSADDAVEVAWAAGMASRSALQVITEGERGGHWTGASEGRWEAVPPPGPVIDSYGAGDSFAAGLTFALGAGLDVAAGSEAVAGLDLATGPDVAAACRIAAECGARALTHPGGP